jgi:hypothetical protein
LGAKWAVDTRCAQASRHALSAHGPFLSFAQGIQWIARVDKRDHHDISLCGYFFVRQRSTVASETSPTTDDPQQTRLVDAVLKIPSLLEAEPWLVRRGRFLTADFQLVIGRQVCFMSVVEGKITVIETRPQIMRAAAFRIAAEVPAWLHFWKAMPEPGWHDILAMMKRNHLTVDGDLRVFMGNLQYIKDVVALPRRILGVV